VTPREEVEHLDVVINALTKRRDELNDEIRQADHDEGEAKLEALIRGHGHPTPVDGCVLCIVHADLDQTREPS
jgi:hypothetical protein